MTATRKEGTENEGAPTLRISRKLPTMDVDSGVASQQISIEGRVDLPSHTLVDSSSSRGTATTKRAHPAFLIASSLPTSTNSLRDMSLDRASYHGSESFRKNLLGRCPESIGDGLLRFFGCHPNVVGEHRWVSYGLHARMSSMDDSDTYCLEKKIGPHF